MQEIATIRVKINDIAELAKIISNLGDEGCGCDVSLDGSYWVIKVSK